MFMEGQFNSGLQNVSARLTKDSGNGALHLTIATLCVPNLIKNIDGNHLDHLDKAETAREKGSFSFWIFLFQSYV